MSSQKTTVNCSRYTLLSAIGWISKHQRRNYLVFSILLVCFIPVELAGTLLAVTKSDTEVEGDCSPARISPEDTSSGGSTESCGCCCCCSMGIGSIVPGGDDQIQDALELVSIDEIWDWIIGDSAPFNTPANIEWASLVNPRDETPLIKSMLYSCKQPLAL